MFNGRSAYIVKQSSGFMRCFLYVDGTGIVERIFKKNQWSKYNIVIKNAQKNFSVVLYPDDEMGIIYQDKSGNVFLTMYNDEDDVTYNIYRNVENNNVYFEAFADEKDIHIFYTMKNRRTEATTLFHQRIDAELKLSPINIIGNLNFDYEVPFAIHHSRDGKLYVIYQRYKDNHKLGYKELSRGEKIWSRYQAVDQSSEPFSDFLLIEADKTIGTAYVKKEEGVSKLMYHLSRGSDSGYFNIDEHEVIESSSLFKENDHVWCTWIKDNKINAAFTLLNDGSFSSPPYAQEVRIENVGKCVWLSNFPGDERQFEKSEVYVVNNNGPEYLSMPEIYRTNSGVRKEDASLEGYISGQILKKLERYLDEINEKDQVIRELKEEISKLKKEEQ